MSPTVLFVDHDRGRSGATVSMEYLVRAFCRAGCTVVVLSPKGPEASAGITGAGGSVVALNVPGVHTLALDLHFSHTLSAVSPEGLVMIAKNVVKFFLGVWVICRAARRVRAGLIYVNEYVVIQGSVAGWLCGIPSVLHVRSLMLRGAFGVRRRILSFLILACNRKVFAISAAEERQIRGTRDARKKIAVVGEFVDPPVTHPADGRAFRETLGVREDQVLIIMVGGIDPVKGSREYLQSVGLVRHARPDAVFALAGRLEGERSRTDPGYHEECMQIVSDLRRTGGLLVLGYLVDPGGLIEGSDIVVVPSALTHFSRPVVEAWSRGKPVVVSATEHMRALVTDGLDGLHFPVGDAGALARALVTLAGDRSARVRMGEEGRKKARRLFDAGHNTRMILDSCRTFLPGLGGDFSGAEKHHG